MSWIVHCKERTAPVIPADGAFAAVAINHPLVIVFNMIRRSRKEALICIKADPHLLPIRSRSDPSQSSGATADFFAFPMQMQKHCSYSLGASGNSANLFTGKLLEVKQYSATMATVFRERKVASGRVG
ncbi:MAG: hypothetical protein AAGA21_00330 [Pseudomonadota bacterium]